MAKAGMRRPNPDAGDIKIKQAKQKNEEPKKSKNKSGDKSN